MSVIALGIATAISLAMAALLGIFEPRRIDGPARLDEGEQPKILLSIAGMGLFAWGAASLFASSAVNHQGPAKLSSIQQVLINGAMDLAAFIGLIGATLVFRPNGIRRVGMGMSRFPRGLLGGVISVIIVLPLINWVEVASEAIWNGLGLKHAAAHDFLLILGNTESPWMRAAIVVITVVLAPLAEELFFRGQLQTFFRYTLKEPWSAVAITAALFALVHPTWWAWPSLFFLGVCLGYIYERTGNLWNCVVLHALFNLASIYIYVHAGSPR
jgi:membrane protease YdiL (CAAX protease family)